MNEELIRQELGFQTTRSGGKGGQNVNKVETAVIVSLMIAHSAGLSDQEKTIISQKLSNRISNTGHLQLKAQTARTQIENKAEGEERLIQLLKVALEKKKVRIATRPGRSAKEARLNFKKQLSERKAGRQKYRPE